MPACDDHLFRAALRANKDQKRQVTAGTIYVFRPSRVQADEPHPPGVLVSSRARSPEASPQARPPPVKIVADVRARQVRVLADRAEVATGTRSARIADIRSRQRELRRLVSIHDEIQRVVHAVTVSPADASLDVGTDPELSDSVLSPSVHGRCPHEGRRGSRCAACRTAARSRRGTADLRAARGIPCGARAAPARPSRGLSTRRAKSRLLGRALVLAACTSMAAG